MTIDNLIVRPHGKLAKNESEASLISEDYDGKPHAWIQWKGTNVCMDVHCKCGKLLHVDDYFAYNVKCPHCKTIYYCNGHIELIELLEKPKLKIIEALRDDD